MNETTTRAPQEKVCGYEYTVRRGDSFYLIAHRLGVPLRDLLEANADINPARLMVGDVLCIPMEEDDSPAPETQLPAAEPEPVPQPLPDAIPVPEVTIEEEAEILPEPVPEGSLDMPATDPEASAEPTCSGTRYTVSEGETAADIQLDTGLSFNTLQSANPTVSLDQLAAGEVLCIPPENIPCSAAATYRIQSGENLESVALRLNASLSRLLRANPCLAPADFTEGVCIAVPN